MKHQIIPLILPALYKLWNNLMYKKTYGQATILLKSFIPDNNKQHTNVKLQIYLLPK